MKKRSFLANESIHAGRPAAKYVARTLSQELDRLTEKQHFFIGIRGYDTFWQSMRDCASDAAEFAQDGVIEARFAPLARDYVVRELYRAEARVRHLRIISEALGVDPKEFQPDEHSVGIEAQDGWN